MSAPGDGSPRGRAEGYQWRAFPVDDTRSYREAHAYQCDQFDRAVLLLTPWCEEGSLHPLRHDRPSVGAPIDGLGAGVPCCVRCWHRWNAAVLEAQQAEVAR